MPKSILLTLSLFFLVRMLFSQDNRNPYDDNWAEWRGPASTGEAPYGDPPIEWSETKNIKWKIEIPGKGHATPIIWEDKVFILTAVETDQKIEMGESTEQSSMERRGPPSNQTDKKHDFVVISIDRKDGSVNWQKVVCQEHPVDRTHNLGTWASNSPVTDGKHLFAYFGSRGLYCLDFDGNVLWERDFGQMEKKMSFGEGSSPTLHKDKVVVLWDHEGDSFLYIINKNTGEDIMKIGREEATSWASPLTVDVQGKTQIITSATAKIRSYDLETGQIIWTGTGMTRNVIPNPIVSNGILYLMSGFRGSALQAIDLSRAKGDITGTDAIVWEYNEHTPYTPSALLASNKLYFLRGNKGDLTCLDAADGKVNYSLQKLEGTGTIFASPVGAKDRLYITSQSGITYVVKQGSDFEILATNELEDGNFASPAIVGDELFIRGFKYLYCISED